MSVAVQLLSAGLRSMQASICLHTGSLSIVVQAESLQAVMLAVPKGILPTKSA